jgi:hypothetical protein
MEYSDVTRLEQKLVGTLKEEYSFYQSLFILLDKQRDHIKYDRERRFVDLYSEVERLYGRIQESETSIATLRQDNRKLFSIAASTPEVRRLANSIATLVSKSLKLIRESRETVDQKHRLLTEKLAELQNSSKITGYLRTEKSQPIYLDRKN